MLRRSKRRPPESQSVHELRALQRLVAAAIMRPLTSASRMDPQWLDGGSATRIVARVIKPNDRLSSFERLELYNRQYWFRLLDCFDEDYPGLRAVLGKRRFSRLAREYLTDCPSTSFTMRNLGQFLVNFLQTHPALVQPDYQLALDMARLEWAHVEAFDNAALPTLKEQELHAANPQSLHLRLQPHLTLLRLQHQLDGFLIAVRRGQGLRREASNAVGNRQRQSDLSEECFYPSKPCCLAVYRYRDSVYYKRLQSAQFVLLEALRRGLPLEQALEQTRDSGASAALLARRIADWFRDWSALGWFAAARIISK